MNKNQDIQELVSVIEEQAQNIKLLTETIERNDRFHKKELAKLRRLRLTLTSEHVIDIQELRDEILYQGKRIYQLESETAVPKRKFPKTTSTRSCVQIQSPVTNGDRPQNGQDGGLPNESAVEDGRSGIYAIDFTDEIFANIDERNAFEGLYLRDDILSITQGDTDRCDTHIL